MENVIKWLKENLGDNIEVTWTPHERTEKLDFEFVPENEEQFYKTINEAPWDILKGMGFRKWSSMNEIIQENQEGKNDEKTVEIPIINSNESCCMKTGTKNPPKELLEEDEVILLFPGEWFESIPEGFITTGLFGEEESWEKAKSDDDIRFGCLAYGIRKPMKYFEK